MQASDIMTDDIISVTPETPVRDIARALLDHGIVAVPVLDTSGAPVGTVREGDLVVQLGTSQRIAGDVMISPALTVSAQTPLTEIARLLSENGVRRIPVVKDGRIVGIVHREDLLRALAADAPHADAHAGPKGEGHLLEDVISLFIKPCPLRHKPLPQAGL